MMGYLLTILISADSLNVRLVASWSDGNSNTSGACVVAAHGWVFLGTVGYPPFCGLYLIDARNPQDDSVLEAYLVEDSLRCRGLAITDTFLYALLDDGAYPHPKVYKIDWNTPIPTLTPVGTWQDTFTKDPELKQSITVQLLIEDTLMFRVYNGGGNVAIYSLSDPTNPSLISVCVFPAVYQVAFLPPHYLYVNSDSLYVLDISDPTDPVVVGTGDRNPPHGGMAIWDHFLYVGDWYYIDLFTYDISDPINPTFSHWQLSGNNLIDFYVRDDAPRIYTVKPLSVWEPNPDGSMTRLGWYMPGEAIGLESVYWDNGYIYTASVLSIPPDYDLLIFHYLRDIIAPWDTAYPGNLTSIPELRTWISGNTLHIIAPQGYDGDLHIYNPLGQLAYHTHLHLSKGAHHIELPELPRGLYLLKLEDKEEVLRWLD